MRLLSLAGFCILTAYALPVHIPFAYVKRIKGGKYQLCSTIPGSTVAFKVRDGGTIQVPEEVEVFRDMAGGVTRAILYAKADGVALPTCFATLQPPNPSDVPFVHELRFVGVDNREHAIDIIRDEL